MNRIITLLITLLCLGNVCAQNNKKLVVYQKNGAKVEYKLSEIEKVNVEEIVMVNSISLNTTSKQLEKGQTLQLSATVLPTNAENKTVSWSSSNTSIATVSTSGLVTAKGYGTATITATAADGSGVSSKATINVVAPSLVPAFTVPSGVTLNTTNSTSYPWENNSGTLTPGNAGVNSSDSYFTATITSTSATTLSFNWYVSSESGYDFLYYSVDGGTETKISGSTSSESKSISLTAGTHTVKFGYRKDSSASSGSDKGWISNIVITKSIPVSSITLSSTNISLSPSETRQLTASIYPNNATNKKVNWTTSNSNVATVSSTGLVTAKNKGTATITATATDGSGVNAKATIMVVSANNGHEYVDLGLSVRWATCNIGASKSEEYGDYFAWGATTPLYESGYAQEDPQNHWKAGKSDGYCYNNTPYQTENASNFSWTKWTKYLGVATSSYKDPSATNANALKTVLDPEDDAARANWGGTWRMPTKEEQDELLTKCTWTLTTQNGINGFKVTSNTNGNSIFLPAAGCRIDGILFQVGKDGYFWSSSLNTSYVYRAHNMYFHLSDAAYSSNDRYFGYSVRPVCP